MRSITGGGCFDEVSLICRAAATLDTWMPSSKGLLDTFGATMEILLFDFLMVIKQQERPGLIDAVSNSVCKLGCMIFAMFSHACRGLDGFNCPCLAPGRFWVRDSGRI